MSVDFDCDSQFNSAFVEAPRPCVPVPSRWRELVGLTLSLAIGHGDEPVGTGVGANVGPAVGTFVAMGKLLGDVLGFTLMLGK